MHFDSEGNPVGAPTGRVRPRAGLQQPLQGNLLLRQQRGKNLLAAPDDASTTARAFDDKLHLRQELLAFFFGAPREDLVAAFVADGFSFLAAGGAAAAAISFRRGAIT